MNEQAINDAHQLFSNAGWNGSVNEFLNLINSNTNALNDAYQLFSAQGYNKTENDFLQLMGLKKIEDIQEVETSIVPKVNIEDTEIASELSSLGLSDEEFNNYQRSINNALAETETEMKEVIAKANDIVEITEMIKVSEPGMAPISVPKTRKVYPFHKFLNENQSNIEEAKEKWIQQEREKIQSAKLEEVFSELKADVLPLWTGPVGIASGILNIPFPPLQKEQLEYEKTRNILYDEYIEKLNNLDDEGGKIVDNIKMSISQFDILDVEINQLAAYYKDNPPSSQSQVDYFNQLIQKRQSLYSVYKKNRDRLNEISVNLKSIENIADLVKRTYSNVDVAGNRIGSTVLKLGSGLTKTVKELGFNRSRVFDVDLNSEEHLETLPEYIRPLAKGMGNLEDYLDKASLKLYNEAEKINEFTKKRQEFGEIKSFEDFAEFTLDLFSEQGVNTAITASTGGLGLFAIAAGATGNKFTAMDLELENGRYNPRTDEFEKIKISPMQYYTSGMGYGFAEYVTEKVALDNYKLGVKGFRKAIDIAGGKYSLKAMSFKNALKTYGVSVGREGTSELVASLMQNSLDRWVLENKEVGVWDGTNEAFWSGALMSGLGFNAPALAAAGYRAVTSSKGWKKINENSKKLLNLQEVYDTLSLQPKNQETLDAMKAVREQMDELLTENLIEKGFAEKRIDQLSNNDKRTLLDLETKRNRFANQIDKINDSNKLSNDQKKSLINRYGKQIDNISLQKDLILNNAMFSSDMRKTTKLTIKDAILKGLKIKSITADNNKDALKQALAHVDQSNLEAEQKKTLKDKIKETFEQVDVHVHGFAVGSEQGLPIQFQMKSNATNAQSGNASVHSHELGHNSLFARLLDPENNADALGLVDEFEKYIRNRFSEFSKFIKEEGKFQLTQYATDVKTVREELQKEEGREPTIDEINDKIYLNKVKIAEEKLAVAIDYIRQFHNEKIDKSFKGKLLDKWNKTRDPNDINEIQNGEDIYNMLTSFVAGFEKGEMSGLAAKVIAGKVKARKREGKVVKEKGVIAKPSMTAAQKAKVKEAVDKLGQVDTDGNDLTKKGEGNFYYQADVENVIKKLRKKRTDKKLGLENEAYLDNLIAAQYKVRPVPTAFVNDVFNQLLTDIEGFKPEQNNSLFGYLGPRIKFRAGDVYKEIYEKKGPATVPTEEKTKEGEVKVQVKADKDVAMEELETKDIGIAAQIKEEKAKKEGKKEVKRESEFRNRIGFKTGSQIYNEILDTAKKTLIRAYAKTKNIKDVAARERAVVAEIQKEHNNLTSPLFKQIKNWLTYGLAQEVVPRGTKDIYFSNLKEFREDITKLISTADLVQIERIISEVDRIFTVYRETLTRKGDVEKAVDNLELPPDAIRKYDKNKKVSVYDKVIPNETQIVAFANQPAKIPAKDKSGNIRRNDNGDVVMIRSGLKGTRKDGITKNIVNGLVFDAVMEARQSKEVQDKLKELGVDATSVQELSVATGRPVNLKFSKNIAKGDISAFAEEAKNNIKKVYFNFGTNDRQRRKAVTSLGEILKATKDDPVLTAIFTHMRNRVNEGLSFGDIINSTYNEHVKGMFEGVESNMYAAFFNGNLSEKHLTNILGLAKKITEAQINDIAFNDAIADIQKNNSDKNIQKFLRQYSKQIRTAKFKYKGETITKNEHVLNFIINDVKPKNKFGLKKVLKGKRITFNNKEQFTFQNSTETKEVFKNNNTNEVNEAIETNTRESKEAIDSTIEVIKSDKTTETKKAIIKSFFADTDAIGRKIAKFGIMTINYGGETVLDHRVPINKVIKEIFKTIDNPTEKNITNLQGFLEDTRINNIPQNVDKKLVELGKKTEGGMEVMENSEVQNLMEGVETTSYNGTKFSKSNNFQKIDKAVMFSRSTNNPTKGITVLDFDDTLATTKSLVKFTRPDGTTGTLNAEQYASTYENLLDQGYKFDFSEFNKVVKGKLAPLFQKALKLQKKFGPENMFVLTARPPAAANAIHKFLKENGLNIPLKNITGLANSTAEAKALWIADKVGEGYNDFYFADDALQNVKAVKNTLDQFDVKSKVQQARVKFSKGMSNEFNNVLERTTGVPAKEIISRVRAIERGAKKGKYQIFLPPSAEDFKGLLYYFVGKGRQGDKDMAFLKKALIDPLNRAYTEFNGARQAVTNDYRALKKSMPEAAKKVNKTTPDADFTYGDAVRVYLWNKAGFDIPGLSKKDIDNLIEMVTSDPQLQVFADKLGAISRRPEGYTQPGEYWKVGDIRNDLDDATGKIGRKEFFTEFIENTEEVFGKMVSGKLTGDNINKIEAIYGTNFREALEDILYRTINGTSRPYGSNKLINNFTNWVNGSVGAVMFVNMRSALLQQMSTVNFINYGDNNIFKAAARLADQKQFWKDWVMIFNSDKLKQRRAGLSMDINANELTTYLNKSKSKTKAAINWLLRKGFKPTQISDSIAIANGGATFYRNRVNTYLKQGLSQKEAEAKAWNDFSEIAEETQQSARPDMASPQQASAIGKWFLNFLNTPMQYSRIIKKSALDLINRRRIPGMTQAQSDTTNISRILYYGFAQNVIFYTLQTGLFAALFDDEDDEESKKFFKKRYQMTANSIVDGLLRGTGFGGAAISTLKNAIIKFIEEDKKGFIGKPGEMAGLEMINLSPVVGIKVQKIVRAGRAYSWDKDVVKHMETFDIDNPIWGVATGITEGLTNIPVNRLYRKTMNLRAASQDDIEAWQRLALISGWSVWNIGMQNEELKRIKEELKEERKKLNKKKRKSKRGRR